MASSSLSSKRSFSSFQRETAVVSKKVYDAFINHRGPDVKETVAFALYDSLEEKGCWTFLDDMEFQLGDSITSAIQDAIYSSKVQIAIFSPRYAESSWCLDELLLMLETKARFIPIFCDVKPFELRYPEKGVYAAAFAKHEEKGRVDKEKLGQWKSALHSSSLISGYEFSTCHDNLERLCTKITLAVQQEVGKLNVISTHGEVGSQADAAAASTGPSKKGKKSSLLPRDSHPVGLESKIEDIRRLLQDPQVPVIAVVGMGGSGKTFLLQNVYKTVKSEYDQSIWLSISKTYHVKDLQRDIASHIGINSETASEERAAELIHDRLHGQRCLIVLDDLWTLSTEDSLIDKLGLPADNYCKVVITTRNRQVALNSGALIYEMRNLSDEDSWRLFCIYAFPNSVGNRVPQQMEEEGRKIVKQCGNLPLAIKTVAASLAHFPLVRKWELKRSQLERVVNPIGELDHVMEILKLSYDSLSAQLKPCFAYLSFFPEDEEIDAEYLINLWTGEGFVGTGEEQWEIGWDWLDQLAQLCLLEVYEVDRDGYLYRFCRMHDLLHDLAIHISKEDKCVFSVEQVSTHTSSVVGWSRILVAKKGLDDLAILENCPLYLRTLSLYLNREITSIPKNLFTHMRGLRVLDLSSTNISALPSSLGKMVLLKVLNLKDTQMMEVPECVKHLKSLLFLALPHSCRSVPAWISELSCLRHLDAWDAIRMPKQISKLTSLKTLRSYFFYLSIEEDEFMMLEDLVSMTQLEEVWLKVKHEMEMKRTEEGILGQLVKMRRLYIWNTGTELLHFSEKMRAMKHLEILKLCMFIVPSWISEFADLRELDLSEFECSDFPELQAMPNLVVLRIHSNKRCRKLPKAFGESGGFPRLRILQIGNLSLLEEFPELEDGAMAYLQKFVIFTCPKLENVEGLERLKRLKAFHYSMYEQTNECWESLKEGGEYWYRIKAINPDVLIEIDN